MNKLLLIDGHSLAYRAYFAMLRSNLSTSNNEPTGALYGFINMFSRLVKKVKPTHIAVAFDRKEKTFRHEILKEYKANREAPDEDFLAQLPMIEEFLESLSITFISKAGFEADDILATLSSTASKQSFKSYISSGDRDTFQLIDENVSILWPKKGVSEIEIMDDEAVFNKYNVHAKNYPDLAALTGETSDNIPGVPGVGPKTAAKLINEYGTLENLLDNAQNIKGKVGEAIAENVDNVKRNRSINRLKNDVDLGISLDDLRFKPASKNAIYDAFDRFEFGNTLRNLVLSAFTEGANAVSSSSNSDGVATPNAPASSAKPAENNISSESTEEKKTENNPENAGNSSESKTAPLSVEQNFLFDLSEFTEKKEDKKSEEAKPVFSENKIADDNGVKKNIAIEVQLVDPLEENISKLESRSICFFDGESFTKIDLQNITPETESQLLEILNNTSYNFTCFDYKRLSHALLNTAIKPDKLNIGLFSNIGDDIKIAAYVDDPAIRAINLFNLARHFLNASFEDIELLEIETKTPKKIEEQLESETQEIFDKRTQLRLKIIYQLHSVLINKLKENNTYDLYKDVEIALAKLLVKMEFYGIAIDDSLLNQQLEVAKNYAEQAENSAYAVIGKRINLSSPKQLQEILFNELAMPKTKKNKTGYTTDAGALKKLLQKTKHPFLEHLLAFRDYTKVYQILEGLLTSIDTDGRVHTTLLQTNTSTGRLASKNPNLQNVPIGDSFVGNIREVFIVDRSRQAQPSGDNGQNSTSFETLFTADYSQIEMRILAHMSGDKYLVEAFNRGVDLHTFVASKVFNVPEREVDSVLRSKVKAVSYGLAYGLSVFGLSQQLNISMQEAKEIYTDYFAQFASVKNFFDNIIEQAKADGYTSTILGRRRYIPDLMSKDPRRENMARRMALNAPIQGSAADIIKIAMVNIDKEFLRLGLKSRLILQIHDELIIEVAEGELEKVKQIVINKMETAVDLKVPLKVAVGIGKNWNEAGH